MSRKKQVLKTKSYLNIEDEKGVKTQVLVKDVDGSVNLDYKEIFEKYIMNIHIRCAKAYVKRNGINVEILDK